MNNAKITSGKSLSEAIESIIKETTRAHLYTQALQEKEKQVASSPAPEEEQSDDNELDDLFGDDDDEDSTDDSSNEEQPSNDSSKTVDDETSKLKQGDVETKDIIEKLNTIRSGKSFKDELILKNMEQYVGSLKIPERTALFAFLKGIAQITTGEIEAQAASEPEGKPADVTMQKGDEVKTKHVDPNVIKTSAAAVKPSNKPPAENRSGPVPITPKRKK
jgi:hypothetical protein